MSLKEYALAGTLIGALAYGATEAQAQNPNSRMDSTRARVTKSDSTRIPISGLFASPFEKYCLVPRNQAVCPSYSQPTAQAAETTRTRADTSSGTSTGPRAAQTPRRIPTNPIGVLDSNLTSAGSGYFVTNPIFNFTFEDGVPFNRIFYSKTPFRVEFRELRRGLENITRAEGTGSATDSYLRYLIENNPRNNLDNVRTLTTAATDNNISPGELLVNGQPAIAEGLYLANISNGTASTNMLIRFNYSPRARADTSGAVLPDTGYRRGRAPQLDSAEVARARTDSAARAQTGQRTGQEFVPPRTPRRRGKPSFRLTFDALAGESEMKGAGMGIGYGIIGLSVNYSQTGNRVVDSLTVPLSAGRYGTGREEEIDFKSLGAATELHLGPFFIGAGANLGYYTTRTQESIIATNRDTLKTETNSHADNGLSYRLFGGVEIPLSNRLGLRVFGGRDNRNGIWGGIGGKFRVNKR